MTDSEGTLNGFVYDGWRVTSEDDGATINLACAVQGVVFEVPADALADWLTLVEDNGTMPAHVAAVVRIAHGLSQ